VNHLTDEHLLETYRDGQEAALGILMRRYEGELLGFLTRLMGSRTAAEDAFQETFLQIHVSAATFDTSRRFKPWLFTIAANKGRDYFRKYGRQSSMMDLSAPVRGANSENGAGVTFVDLLEADLPDLDAPLSDDERRERVRGVVYSMPYALKEIILLAYFQRLSYNQIAATLDIPLGTVKSRLHSAIGEFAERWKRLERNTFNTD